MVDSGRGCLRLEEGLARLETLVARGRDGVEPSFNLMRSYKVNIGPYIAVSARRALRDWVVPRLWTPAGGEAYFLPLVQAVEARTNVPVIQVGGVRSTDRMTEIIVSRAADFFPWRVRRCASPTFPTRSRRGGA
ncbi:MAG: oxidase, partial [Rhodospirillales bacterium]|nr:oxidase [Rhodospirillales bacterium]